MFGLKKRNRTERSNLSSDEILRKRIDAIKEINEGIIGVLDSRELVNLITNHLVSVIDVTFAVVLLWDDSEDTLSVGSLTVPKAVESVAERAMGGSISSFVLEAGNGSHVNNHYVKAIESSEALFTKSLYDVSQPFLSENSSRLVQRLLGMKLALTIPLMARKKKLGVLGLIWKEENISDDDMSIVNTFANQISIALYNAQLFEKVNTQVTQLQLQNSQLESISTLSNAVVSTLDPKKVAQRAVDMIPNKLGYLGGIIALKVKDKDEVRITAITESKIISAARELLGKDPEDYPILLNDPEFQELPAVRVMNGELYVATDSFVEAFTPALSKRVAKSIQKALGAKSISVVPIRIRGEVVGAIGFMNKEKTSEEVTQEDRNYMQTIAQVTSIALDNSVSFRDREIALKRLDEASKELAEKNQELQIKSDDLVSKNTALEEARRRERDMLDVMGHELRTPLSIIKMTMGILRNKSDNSPDQFTADTFKKYAPRISDALHREVRLLEAMLSSAKLDSDKMELHMEKVDINTVAGDAVLAQQESASIKGLELKYTPVKGSVFVYADKVRLGEVVDNFVNNAVKYTNEGFVEVVIEPDFDEKHVKFSVIDSGVGIAEENIKNLGKKFYRVKQYGDEDVSRPDGKKLVRPGGTGLGLYVSFGLVSLMGGKIDIKSEVGKGSTFSFVIPKFTDQEETAKTESEVKNVFERLKLK